MNRKDNLQKYLKSLTLEEYKVWCDMKRKQNKDKRKRQHQRKMQNPEYAKQFYKNKDKKYREYLLRELRKKKAEADKLCFKLPKMSKGEMLIYQYLKAKGYIFEQEKTFDTLLNTKGTAKLRLDFYLPELLIAIEFDGEQHYKFTEKFHINEDDWKRQWDNDRTKDFFCTCKGIKMIRIKQNEISKVTEILDREIE